MEGGGKLFGGVGLQGYPAIAQVQHVGGFFRGLAKQGVGARSGAAGPAGISGGCVGGAGGVASPRCV